MKKILQILIVIIAAYIFAYVKVGYIKGYKFIPENLYSFLHKKQNNNDPDYQVKLNEAISYFNNEDYYEACDKLKKLYYDYNYQTTEVKYLLAKAYNLTDRDSLAYNLFSDIVKKTDPLDSFDSAYFYMAKIDYSNSNYDQAYYNIDQFLTYEPKSSEGNDWLAWIMYDITDDVDSALKYEYISIKLDSTNADPYYGVAHFLENKADDSYNSDSIEQYFSEALEYGKKSLELDTSLNAPYYYIAYAYYNLNNFDSAIAYFKKYIDRYGVDYDSYYYMTKSFLNLKESDSVLKYADFLIKYIEDNDSLQDDYELKAEGELLKKDYEMASLYFYKAYNCDIKTLPANTYLLLAAKYAQKFDKATATDYLNEYLDAYDDDYNNKDSVLEVLKSLNSSQ